MSRSFRFEKRYSLGAAQTFAVLTDPDFLEQRARHMGSTDPACTREDHLGGAVTMELQETRTVPGKKAPLRSTLTFRWSSPTTAEWSQCQHGYEDRSSAAGAILIREVMGPGCTVIITGVLEIRVPLIGRVLERTILKKIKQGQQKEAEFFEAWILRQGPG